MMRINIGATILTTGLLLASSAHANSDQQTTIETTNTATTTPTEPSEEAAARWGLTMDEYAKYEAAMAGLRGRLSDARITPIEVLGIEAKTPAERRKYAESWVRLIEADTAKVLEFSNAVNDAWARLHPATPMIDRDRINRLRARAGSKYQSIPKSIDSLMLNGRLLVFTRDNCGSCNENVKSLVARAAAGEFKGVDLYLLDASPSDQSRIQAWARSVGVPASAVRARTVTLNFDSGAYERLTGALGFSPGVFPAVFHHKGGEAYEFVRVK